MTANVATLNSFVRQLDAPKGCGRLATEEYGADHRNDWTGKLAHIGDVWNAVCDAFVWFCNSRDTQTLDKFRQSEDSRGGIELQNFADKKSDINKLNTAIVEPLLQNSDKMQFDVVTGGNRKLKFKQAEKDAWIKYVTIEKWENNELVESKTLYGKTFFDLYQDLHARFSSPQISSDL